MTLEAARALSPDEGTLKRAESLAHPRMWIVAESNGRALWGESWGSGSEPYRAVVDMNGPAFKCSCPVKRFPCKHTLALLLMAASDDPKAFGQNTPPQYVTDWLDNRDRKQVAKFEPRTDEQIAKSEAAKDKTRHERLEIMEVGIADLQRRLLDIIRQGLASLENISGNYWQDFASRMVDAKMGGLSRRIKSWASYQEQYPEDWYERLLSELGMVYLFAKAFNSFDKITEVLQTDMLIQAGLSVKKEDLMKQKGIEDDWMVMAQTETKEEDNLTSRRVWLLGKNLGKIVLVLDFTFGNTGFQTAWISGAVYTAELVFYPAAYPLRVAVKNIEINPKTAHQFLLSDNLSIIDFANLYSKAVAANPWVSDFPILLTDVVPVFHNNRVVLVDKNNQYLTCTSSANDAKQDTAWVLMSVSGGTPISVFGEWTNEEITPLSILTGGRLIIL